jgi:hypothetical protein
VVFLLDPANQDFLDGKTRRLGARTGPASIGCLLLFLIPFLVIGIFVVGWTINSWQRYHALNQLGEAGTGEIIDKRISSGDDSDIYYLRYAYSHNGTTYSSEQSVEWNIYNSAEIGATVDIEYVPSNPQISTLAGGNEAPTSHWRSRFAGISSSGRFF